MLTFTIGGNNTVVSLATGTTIDQAIAQINGTMASLGVHAQLNTAGTGIDLQGTAAFTVSSNGGGATGVFGTNANTAQTITAPVANAGGERQCAAGADGHHRGHQPARPRSR